jgi:hypothetical protein
MIKNLKKLILYSYNITAALSYFDTVLGIAGNGNQEDFHSYLRYSIVRVSFSMYVSMSAIHVKVTQK